jgi:hypothetical protein
MSPRTASEIAAPVDADDGSWIDVALSHSYARGLTMLYVDGVLAGTTAEQLVPLQFVLGGRGELTNRPPAPAVLDLQDWCLYRAPWTPKRRWPSTRARCSRPAWKFAAPERRVLRERRTRPPTAAQSLSSPASPAPT